ncbi:MAG: DUF3880 domain-containing protein [Lachnospiraceae bacterium]
MKILYYTWSENAQNNMTNTLMKLGHQVTKCHIPFQDYEEDQEFRNQMEKILIQQESDAIFSFDYFPLVAKVAKQRKIKYISWIYDCPHWSLCSPSVKSPYNYIFLFDRQQYMKLLVLQLPHIFYFPLASNTVNLEKQLETLPEKEEYQNEISFVGSLYDNNKYRQINFLPEYLRGYLEGIMEAQLRIYGYHFIEELLTPNILTELEKYVKMNMDSSYCIEKTELYADLLDTEITCKERVNMLKELAKSHQVTLYTGSDMSLVPGVRNGGIVSYDEQLPLVYQRSKINLNITLRSITSGMPGRIFDIMGSGGFLLSNYQPELAEVFQDGKELVLYESQVDLLEKVSYYLEHEEERKEIAYRGWKRMQEEFSYPMRVKKMLEYCE